MTLYEELELPTYCSFDDIKQQYRKLSMIHHPDLGGDVEKFKRIKFAYEVLSDPERRKQYDLDKTTGVTNDIHTEAISKLANIFFAIMPTFNCNEGNLISAMTQETNNLKNRAHADLMMCEVYISNIETVKKKLKIKNPNSDNIIMSFIEKQLESRYKDKELFKHTIKLSDEMLLILDNYDYGFLELFNGSSSEPTLDSNT